jgi:hypothetical protein
MKKLALGLLLAGSSFALADDNDLLQNGDFSDGISHWYGDCHTIADMTSQESDYQAPAAGTGAVVKLRAGEWTKMTQDFDTKPGTLHLAITYTLSPGLTFSQRAEDYTNTTGNIGYTAWLAYPTSVGAWVVMLCDIAAGHANVFEVPLPSNAPSGAQTFNAGFRAKSDEQKSICFGFPPGKGFITVEKVSITTGDQ